MWGHEATSFTPWLEARINELNEAIGLEIEITGREERVGAFAVDLFGHDVQTGRAAIIENQLEPTDHNHLGQLLTYAAGLDAGLIVWIAPQFRAEHREALKWLNDHSPEEINFFGVELQVLDINGQRAANFNLVAEPNAWQKASSKLKHAGTAEASDRMLRYQAFFATLLDLKTVLPSATSATKTQPQSWFAFSAGAASTSFAWVFKQGKRFALELTVDTSSQEENQHVVGYLRERSITVPGIDADELQWDISDTRWSQRAVLYFPRTVDIESEHDLEELREWAVDSMRTFVQHFRPLLRERSGSSPVTMYTED